MPLLQCALSRGVLENHWEAAACAECGDLPSDWG